MTTHHTNAHIDSTGKLEQLVMGTRYKDGLRWLHDVNRTRNGFISEISVPGQRSRTSSGPELFTVLVQNRVLDADIRRIVAAFDLPRATQHNLSSIFPGCTVITNPVT